MLGLSLGFGVGCVLGSVLGSFVTATVGGKVWESLVGVDIVVVAICIGNAVERGAGIGSNGWGCNDDGVDEGVVVDICVVLVAPTICFSLEELCFVVWPLECLLPLANTAASVTVKIKSNRAPPPMMNRWRRLLKVSSYIDPMMDGIVLLYDKRRQ